MRAGVDGIAGARGYPCWHWRDVEIFLMLLVHFLVAWMKEKEDLDEWKMV